MAQKLIGDPNLKFVAPPALLPPEIIMGPDHLAQLEKEMIEARNTTLPDDDDEDL